MGIICAAGHAMGLLTNQGPQPWHPASDVNKQAATQAREYCKQNGVELGKLAMHYFSQLKEASTFLVGMQTQELIDMNMQACCEGLTTKETQVLDYILKK